MIRLELPSQEMLHRVLSYDAGTGCLTWRVRDIGLFSPSPTRSAAHVCSLWNSKHAGAPALRFRTDGGYLRGAIFGSLYYAHRVAWFMVNGDDTLDVDHKR